MNPGVSLIIAPGLPLRLLKKSWTCKNWLAGVRRL